nr:MAG TPA: hypothetical protein [Caudoviricetes sp.]
MIKSILQLKKRIILYAYTVFGCPYVGMWHYISCSEDRREKCKTIFWSR